MVRFVQMFKLFIFILPKPIDPSEQIEQFEHLNKKIKQKKSRSHVLRPVFL